MRTYTLTCIVCEKEFDYNRKKKSYCSTNCEDFARADRQNGKYPIGNEAKLAIQQNYLIIKRALGG